MYLWRIIFNHPTVIVVTFLFQIWAQKTNSTNPVCLLKIQVTLFTVIFSRFIHDVNSNKICNFLVSNRMISKPKFSNKFVPALNIGPFQVKSFLHKFVLPQKMNTQSIFQQTQISFSVQNFLRYCCCHCFLS